MGVCVCVCVCVYVCVCVERGRMGACYYTKLLAPKLGTHTYARAHEEIKRETMKRLPKLDFWQAYIVRSCSLGSNAAADISHGTECSWSSHKWWWHADHLLAVIQGLLVPRSTNTYVPKYPIRCFSVILGRANMLTEHGVTSPAFGRSGRHASPLGRVTHSLLSGAQGCRAPLARSPPFTTKAPV